MPNKNQTFEASFHIAILILLGAGALTAYFWLFPLGMILEIVFWFYCLEWI